MGSVLDLGPRAALCLAARAATLAVALSAVACGGAGAASSEGAGGGATSSASSGSSTSGAGGSLPHACPVASSSDPLVAPTTAGSVHGTEDGVVLAFLGVPYAAPPVGSLRFRAPEPPACWSGVREATTYGSACVQNAPTQGAFGSEDCLYLNVWTPSTTGAPRPVLFFVHGGALLFGSGSQDLLIQGTGNLYDGKKLAEEHDAVVVTINYRLAELGFLAHPALSKEDPNGSSGNYGTLDQIAALRWVKDNIAAFGGDPKRVLLFGESAGGLSTCLLLSSPLAKGLFSEALIESGGCTVASREGRYTQGDSIASAVGCAGAPDVPACLRALPADAFRVPPPTGINMFLADGDINSAWDMPFGPNLDDYVFSAQPLDVLRKGEHAKVPLVVGSNATEFELFTPPGVVNTCVDYTTMVTGMFGSLAPAVLAQYPCLAYPLPHYAWIDVGTDFMFTCPARRILRAALAGGTPVAYRYYSPHAYTNSPLTALRAFHASELPFVFQSFDVMGYPPTAGDTAVSNALGGYWSSFAASGNPNGAGAFSWPTYDATTEQALVVDDQLSTKNQIASTHCDFWDSIAP